MIWVRRLIAIVLATVLPVVMVAAIALQTVNRSTNPDFIKAELVKVDAYGFFYDDVLDTAVGDRIESELSLPEGLGQFKFDDPARARRVILDAIKETFPPDYTRRQVEDALDELIPYLKGQTDEFELRPRLDEQARGASRAITRAIDELDLSQQVIDNLLGPAIQDSLKDLSFGGARLNITPDRANAIANRIAPEEWVDAQIASALTEFVSWLTGDQDSFAVTIRFADRVPAASEEIKTLLRETNFTRFLFDSVVAPQVTRALGNLSVLSFDIKVTDAEVKAALETAAPPEWVDQQLGGLIDVMADYLSGASDDLSFSIALEERRAATIGALNSLAQTKLRQAVAGLPGCASPTASAAVVSRLLALRMPECLPPGVNTDAVVSALTPVLEKELEGLIGVNFPKDVTFDRSTLEAQIGGDAFTAIDNARRLIAGGFTFTDADLKKNLAGPSSDGLNLDEIRQFFQPEFTVTQADFLDLVNRDQAAQAGTSAEFELMRSRIGTVVGLLWLLTLLPLVLAAVIGFLGGRQWTSRLAWASAALAISGLIVWIGLSIAFVRVQPILHDELVRSVNEISDQDERRVALAGIEKVDVVVADVAAGARGSARNWTLLGLFGIAAAAGLMYYVRSARTGGSGSAGWLHEKIRVGRKSGSMPAGPVRAQPAAGPETTGPGKQGTG